MTITAVAPTDANTPVTISSQTNTTALTAAINSLVTGYNQVISAMTTEMAYNSTDNSKSGGLANNPIARTLMEQLRSFTTQAIQGYDSSSHTLADIGVKTNLDGTLTLDQTAFTSALTTNPDQSRACLTVDCFLEKLTLQRRPEFIQLKRKLCFLRLQQLREPPTLMKQQQCLLTVSPQADM